MAELNTLSENEPLSYRTLCLNFPGLEIAKVLVINPNDHDDNSLAFVSNSTSAASLSLIMLNDMIDTLYIVKGSRSCNSNRVSSALNLSVFAIGLVTGPYEKTYPSNSAPLSTGWSQLMRADVSVTSRTRTLRGASGTITDKKQECEYHNAFLSRKNKYK